MQTINRVAPLHTVLETYMQQTISMMMFLQLYHVNKMHCERTFLLVRLVTLTW